MKPDIKSLKSDLEEIASSLAPRRWTWLAFGMMAGAALAYFFDNEKGTQRRSMLLENGSKLKSRASSIAQSTTRDLKSKVQDVMPNKKSSGSKESSVDVH